MTSVDFATLHYLAPATPPAWHDDRFYPYEALTNLLRQWEQSFPNLIELRSIGQTRDGRDIWVAIVTNRSTGPDHEKPAYYIDGDIHAAEVTASSLALATIHRLLTGYGHDPDITRLLDQTSLYVIPRIAIDGVEVFLYSAEEMRSTEVEFPGPGSPVGMKPSDINGDGLISSIRFRDPAGAWKTSALDDRIMVKRAPNEYSGEFFTIVPEGDYPGWNGGRIDVKRSPHGIDFNRAFPSHWRPHWQQVGAGPYPLAEPEIRAVAEFILAHPNIHGSLHHHTAIGAILRCSCSYPDSDMPALDLRAYKAIGAIAEEITGYRCISMFHENPLRREVPDHGTFFDWMFDQVGVFCFATELWGPFGAAIDWQWHDLMEPIFLRPESKDLDLLRLFDERAGGRGFTAWTPFDHPQFGPVEIGGWDRKFGQFNPPGPLLKEEIDRVVPFALAAMGTGPLLRIASASAERLYDETWRVRVTVSNDGFLPTYGSETWLKTGQAEPVVASISFADHVELVPANGPTNVAIGHLAGRVAQFTSLIPMAQTGDASKGCAEWIIRARGGTTIEITAGSSRAGTQRSTVTLA